MPNMSAETVHEELVNQKKFYPVRPLSSLETIPNTLSLAQGSVINFNVSFLAWYQHIQIRLVMQKRKVGGASPSQLPLTRRFWQYLLQREVSYALSYCFTW